MAKNIEAITRLAWSMPIRGEYCVVTGCDRNHEWILEWWHNNYKNGGNHYPVYFADFGLSADARDWCVSNGGVVDLRFKCRGKNWFKKPLAILGCPFKKILWIDSDCEIRGDLKPLFEYAGPAVGVTLDPHNPWIKSKDPVASGVIAAEHGNNLILKWAKACTQPANMRGDQEILNELISYDRNKVKIMPPEYQWLRLDGDNKQAIIMHWTGAKGKSLIRQSIGLSSNYHGHSSRVRRFHAGAGRSKRSIRQLLLLKAHKRVRPLKSNPPTDVSFKKPIFKTKGPEPKFDR